jgi:tartrate dehydrogenase/decarboxylase/D-malate dehydrogenase
MVSLRCSNSTDLTPNALMLIPRLVFVTSGIGIEVTAAAMKAITAVQKRLGGFAIDAVELDYSSKSREEVQRSEDGLGKATMSMLTSGTFLLGARYKSSGSYAPPKWLEDLRQYSAILFGAVGDPDVPDHISLWELILPMRQKFQQFVNVRPCTIYAGMQAPTLKAQSGEDLDWVILRENTEGEYAGQGGRTHVGTPMEVATEVAIFTRMGIERFMRFAFATAAKRPKKLLTVVTKSNAQVR